MNPFYSAFYPGEAAKQGLLRLLPVELTLVFDIPINTEPDHPRIWFGQQRRFQIYFLDDDAYKREDLFFWVRGESRAEFFVKSAEPASYLELTLVTGASASRVKVARGWWSTTVEMQPNQKATVSRTPRCRASRTRALVCGSCPSRQAADSCPGSSHPDRTTGASWACRSRPS